MNGEIILAVECQRDRLGRRPNKMVIDRVKSELPNDKRFHSLIKSDKDYWLVSATSSGIPLVEAIEKYKGDFEPFVAIHKISELTGSYILVLYRGPGEILELRFSQLESHHIGMIQDLLSKGAALYVIDKCIILPDSFNVARREIPSAELLVYKELALSSIIKLPVSLGTYFIFSILIFICFTIAVYLYMGEKNKVEAKAVADIYKSFRTGLTQRGSPKAFGVQIYKDIAFSQMVTGWNAETLNFEGDAVAIEFSKIGDSSRTVDLADIARKTGRYLANIGGERVSVISQHISVPALIEAIQVPIEPLQSYLVQMFDDWASSPETQLAFGEVTDKDQYDIVAFDVSISNYFGDDFDTLGTLLNGLPIVLDRGSLTFNDDGSLSGKLNFSIFGCLQKKIDSGICH